jgi:hypothetical protein
MNPKTKTNQRWTWTSSMKTRSPLLLNLHHHLWQATLDLRGATGPRSSASSYFSYLTWLLPELLQPLHWWGRSTLWVLLQIWGELCEGRQARWHLIARWAEVVVQRIGKWRRRGGEMLAGHEVGRASPWCTPYVSLSGERKRKRRGEGFARRGDVRVVVPKRRKKEGKSVTP